MLLICMFCKKEMGIIPSKVANDNLVSHGICSKCEHIPVEQLKKHLKDKSDLMSACGFGQIYLKKKGVK